MKAIEELKEFNKDAAKYLRPKTTFSLPSENETTAVNEMGKKPIEFYRTGGVTNLNGGPATPHETSNSSGDNNYINIISLEGPTDTTHRIGSEPVSIGRNNNNQIPILDESVSRHHAQILQNSGKFYIKDIGSTTGTFIKIREPIQLRRDMIIEIGSFQFLVLEVNVERMGPIPDAPEDDEDHVVLTICDAGDENPEKLMIKHNATIGRRSTNTWPFPEDVHMSNVHGKFVLSKGAFFYEDMDSTNGSWLRLSKEQSVSGPFPLEKGTIFKIGNSAMYQVVFPSKPDETNKNPKECNAVTIQNGNQEKPGAVDKCSICWESERDCLILPCRHNVSCVKCIKSIKSCPLCRNTIEDIIRIYKGYV